MSEELRDGPLERFHKGAQIFALVVMPVVVAVVAWAAQASIAEASSRKDYLQMSLQVLREPRRPDDTEIRAWATQIIAKFSPIPFSAKAGDQLSTPLLGMLDNNPLLVGALKSRPQCPVLNLRALPPDQHAVVEDLQRLCIRNAMDVMWLQTYLGMVKDSKAVPLPK